MNWWTVIGTIAAVVQVWIAWEQRQEQKKKSRRSGRGFSKQLPPTNRFLSPLVTGLLASLIVTSLLMGVVRPVGLLQQWELQAFDWMMRLRPDLGQDERLLVVEVEEEDLKYQDEKGWKRKGSLSDTALVELLEKLEPYKPPAIGLDIYRDFPAQTDLATKLKENPNFFAVCKVSDLTSGNIGVLPPPEIPDERLGFADVVEDSDGVLRRYLWYMSEDSPCKATIAFSLQLAGHYLKEAKGIEVKPIVSEDQLQVGNIRLRRLERPTGGYQKFEDYGYQMLLNYRTRRDIAQRVTLREMLNDEFDRSWVKDRIILIGVTAESFKDDFITPFSLAPVPKEKMRGVFVQGQMVSQILSAVLDGRPLLSVWPKWGESFWVLLWAVAGGLLAWRCQQWRYLILFEAAMMAILYSSCFVLFILGLWVPLVPSAFALVATAGLVLAYQFTFKTKSKISNRKSR